MKKLVIFFCDISGTIDGGKKNYPIDYREFNVLLRKLKEKDEADILLFSLVSSDNKDVVTRYNNTLCSYLDDKITMGKQFYDMGYIEADRSNSAVIGKVWQILNYLNELKETYQIKRIYLADDIKLTPEVLTELLGQENQEKFEPIIPIHKDGLSEVNDMILTKFFVSTNGKAMQKK